MKTLKLLQRNLLYILLTCFIFISCTEEEKYPRYSLAKISYVPDSLKVEHREYITKTISASHYHLSAGKYKHADDLPYAIRNIANELFEVDVIGLRKEYDENYWNDIFLKPNEMTSIEMQILDSLRNAR
jgi:hypothetical protein